MLCMRSFFLRKTLPVAVIFVFRPTARAFKINLAVLLCGRFKFTPQSNCNSLLILEGKKCRVHFSIVAWLVLEVPRPHRGLVATPQLGPSALLRAHLVPSPAPLADTLSVRNERRRMKLAGRIEILLRQTAFHHLGRQARSMSLAATSGSSFFQCLDRCQTCPLGKM